MDIDKQDQIIRNKIKKLDQNFPSELGSTDKLWEDITMRLEQGKKKKHILTWTAAAVIVSLITTYFLINNTGTKELITYKTEPQTLHSEKEVYASDSGENKVLHFINEQCYHEMPACESEEFKELKKQLAEANVEIEEIKKQLALFGPDPSLVKAQISIENQKAYLLTELIQLLKS